MHNNLRDSVKLEKNIQKELMAGARAYFGRLKPLTSFAKLDSDVYVRAIRIKSRILQAGEDA